MSIIVKVLHLQSQSKDTLFVLEAQKTHPSRICPSSSCASDSIVIQSLEQKLHKGHLGLHTSTSVRGEQRPLVGASINSVTHHDMHDTTVNDVAGMDQFQSPCDITTRYVLRYMTESGKDSKCKTIKNNKLTQLSNTPRYDATCSIPVALLYHAICGCHAA